MLSPETIESLKRDQEERERPSLEIPLYPPYEIPEPPRLDDEKAESNRVVVIDLV